MGFLKKQGTNILVWVIVLGMVIIRLTSYGDLNLSIGNADTISYIDGGAGPIFSKSIFTKSRLFTTNLLYHFANVQQCKLQAISYPALGTETYRQLQPCFDRVVFFQNLVSMFAWGILALVVAKRLVGGYEKLIAASIITAFGFTPAIADWDSVLGSESLTFSMFALGIALVIEMCFNAATNQNKRKYSIFIISFEVLILGLWAFTRDSNIYAIAVLITISAISLIFFQDIRKDKIFVIFTASLLVVSTVGFKSSMISRRWETPLNNVYSDLLLPYPARTAFLRQLGMPNPSSAEYSEWFIKNAPRAYAHFLLFHPGYTFISFSSELTSIFSENTQPYFFSAKTSAREALVAANDLLHPNTHLIFILDILLIAALTFALFRKKNKNFVVWVWLGIWLFLSALLTLAVGFFADSIGVTRHTMFAVEIFRLILWLFLIILFDFTNRKDEGDLT
jgi:hypothetical protein